MSKFDYRMLAPYWVMFDGAYSQRSSKLVYARSMWMTQKDFEFHRWALEKVCV